MVMIIEFVPGFGRIWPNRENAGSPKRLRVFFNRKGHEGNAKVAKRKVSEAFLVCSKLWIFISVI